MLRWAKKKLYFSVAYYFRFFAQIQLALWRPRIVVVTGSSGKTTLLHLLEAQLGPRAKYSHHANSTFGIPFDILGFRRKKLTIYEWPFLFLAAPFKAFKRPYKENLYIAEVDAERPGEDRFLASLLKPEVTLWLNSGTTHSTNFDYLVLEKKFATVQEAIAYEFGYLLACTSRLAIVNGDEPNITGQLKRSAAKIVSVSRSSIKDYKIDANGTTFTIDEIQYRIGSLLPEESFYSIAMVKALADYLGVKIDSSFARFALPPGRNSIFKGIKNTTLIDSSYNATPEGVAATLKLFNQYPAAAKWLVMGDMIELGQEEKEEHEKLAELIAAMKLDRIILIGSRVLKYTYPKLKSLMNSDRIAVFEFPKDGLDFLAQNIQGGETLLFKGARFLEGVIEHLLLNKEDSAKLCRRELIWHKRRKEWGL